MQEIKVRVWNPEMKAMLEWEIVKNMMAELLLTESEVNIPMLYIGMKDKNKKEIYAGDILEIETEDYEVVNVVCKYGIARRKMYSGIEVDIPSFYFERFGFDNLKSFPIVNNWQGKHDLEIIKIVGNIYENPDIRCCTCHTPGSDPICCPEK